MSLANPGALALLSLIPLILLLHTLRAEQREVRVSATFLWDEALKEWRTRPGLKKPKLNLLLWVQIAAVAALSVGLARPYLVGAGVPAGRAILIMDVSASMRTVEGARERFAAAKKEAHALIRRLPAGEEMMVLEAGASAAVRSYFTADKTMLHAVVEGIRATDEPGNLDAALNLGLTFAADGGTVYLVTDSAGPPPEALKNAGAAVKQIIVGGGGRNVGITRLAFRRTRDGSGDHQLLLRVRNFTGERVQAGLSLSVNRTLLHRRNLALDAGSAATLIFPLYGLRAGEAVASLDVDDDLPADNVAYAVLSATPTVRVLLVTSGNFFLERALAAHPGIRVTRIAEVDERLLTALMPEHDLAVFDGVPAPRLPGGSYLVIGASVAEPELRVKGPGALPDANLFLPGHPLLKHLEGAEFHVDSALVAELPEEGEFIKGQKRAPLLYSYSGQGLRLVYLGFRLQDSDLVLTPAFPILLGNIVKWLRPGAAAAGPQQVLTGHRYRADFGPQARQATIEGPWGSFTVSLQKGRLQFRDARRAGFYRVRVGEEERWFAANLFNEKESDIRPKTGRPEPRQLAAAAEGTAGEAANPIWRYFLFAALACVAFEGLLLNSKG